MTVLASLHVVADGSSLLDDISQYDPPIAHANHSCVNNGPIHLVNQAFWRVIINSKTSLQPVSVVNNKLQPCETFYASTFGYLSGQQYISLCSFFGIKHQNNVTSRNEDLMQRVEVIPFNATFQISAYHKLHAELIT
jgi:hypothetical protein